MGVIFRWVVEKFKNLSLQWKCKNKKTYINNKDIYPFSFFILSPLENNVHWRRRIVYSASPGGVGPRLSCHHDSTCIQSQDLCSLRGGAINRGGNQHRLFGKSLFVQALLWGSLTVLEPLINTEFWTCGWIYDGHVPPCATRARWLCVHVWSECACSVWQSSSTRYITQPFYSTSLMVFPVATMVTTLWMKTGEVL